MRCSAHTFQHRPQLRPQHAGQHARRIVTTMIGLAHGLDLAVVAEGIEDEATLALLHEARCDFVQDDLIERPAPADDVVRTALL